MPEKVFSQVKRYTPLGTITVALLALCSGCAHFNALREEGSRGGPSKGWLVGGVHLPEHTRSYHVLRSDRDGGQHWGTRRLVNLVQEVAIEMHRAHPTAQPLVVGELSGPRGGAIPRHASHRNGRDVDFLYFALDSETLQPVPVRAFVRYNSQGTSVDSPLALTFDTQRNWSLVETLIRRESYGIVRIFCASWIKRLVMAHARQLHRPDWVIDRAEALLAQPGDSAAHDDHFHVRLACTPAERVMGCATGAPLWHWLAKDWDKPEVAPADDDAVLDALDELAPGVMHGPPTEYAPESLSPMALHSTPFQSTPFQSTPFQLTLDDTLVCRLPLANGVTGSDACFSAPEGSP